MDETWNDDVARLREAQHALRHLIRAGLDPDGRHQGTLDELDRAIARAVAHRWRGTGAGARRAA